MENTLKQGDVVVPTDAGQAKLNGNIPVNSYKMLVENVLDDEVAVGYFDSQDRYHRVTMDLDEVIKL